MENRIKMFFKLFNNVKKPEVFFAPGRVNLLGEHTDYTGGLVLPCALSNGTYLLAEKRNDKKICLYSKQFSSTGILEFNLDDSLDLTNTWADYPLSVIKTLKSKQISISNGLNLFYDGTIPSGAGLSSSASIEVVTRYMLDVFFNLNTPLINQVLDCQFAENKYIGVSCGIMDQFAVSFGKKNNAILLDTNSLEYSYAPLNLENKKIVIVNSNKKRSLNNSSYNERFNSCSEILKILKKQMDISYLGEIKPIQLEECNKYLSSELLIKRLNHIVLENCRTKLASNYLTENKFKLFGDLMFDSHYSLQKKYDVSCFELDTLIEISKSIEGVLGARMTGAGFGGCTVHLIESNIFDDFSNEINNIYFEKTNIKPSIYEAIPSNGVCKLSTGEIYHA